MSVVYHELLPESYLIILAPTQQGQLETALAHQLKCAQRSGKAAVWVDCGMLQSLSAEAARLLWRLHHCLREQRAELVLVHVPEPVKKVLLAQEAGPALSIVPTLLDAARQAHWHQWRYHQHLA
ncbi:hypothetical protein [Hymenobacter antarcticus]|uniref:STAS domain-containing protein n=1 Tax=Hymenobacter antarcticus TaxID=486270 RepID=A0ABP7PAR4_9BACT